MRDDLCDSEKETRDNIAGMAKESLGAHVLKVRGDREWLCQRPGDGNYHFFVLARPSLLVVWGDLGEYVLRMNDDGDVLEWLRQAVDSPDYVFGKVKAVSRNDGSTECWYWPDAEKYLRHCLADYEKDEDQERADVYREVLRAVVEDGDYGITHHWFLECCNEGGLDDMGTVGVGFAAGMWWLLEALKKFMDLLQATKPAALEV